MLKRNLTVAPIPLFDARQARLVTMAVGTLLLCVYGLTAPGYIDISDGQNMFAVTQSVVEEGDFSIPPELGGRPGVLGQYYSKYGILWSALAVPFYVLGNAFDTQVPAMAGRMAVFFVSMINVLVTVLTCVILLRFCCALGFSLRIATLVTLTYGLGTMAWHYALKPFSEPLVALGVLSSSYLLYRNRDEPSQWRALMAGAGIGLAILAKTSALIFVPAMMLYMLLNQQGSWRGRIRSGVIPFLVAVGLGIVIVGAYNHLRFGNYLETGYSFEGAGTGFDRSWDSFLYALYGFLLSPGKSVFLYNPVLLPSFLLLPWFFQRHPREGFLVLACSIMVLIFHSNLVISWYGGWSWGPRFLLPAFPLAVLPIGTALRAARTSALGMRLRQLIFATLVLSIGVQIVAVTVSPRRFYMEYADVQDLQMKSVEDLDYSPLLKQFVYVGEVLGKILGRQNRSAVDNAGGDADNPTDSNLFLNTLHFWWWLAYKIGMPRLPIILAVLLVVAIGMIAVACVFVTLRHSRSPGAIEDRPHLEGSACS